jgi:hypothetical protein
LACGVPAGACVTVCAGSAGTAAGRATDVVDPAGVEGSSSGRVASNTTATSSKIATAPAKNRTRS